MTAPEERLRPRPADRFAGTEHAIDLPAALRALRAESRPVANGHRQITLVHHGPVRLVLFAFHAGGRIPQHRAPGWVTIHVLRGTLRVKTPDTQHELGEGHILALAPDVAHDVDAAGEADMLLGIYPKGLTGSGAASAER
jgi:quercetin dioxygenase-like cupin family protein